MLKSSTYLNDWNLVLFEIYIILLKLVNTQTQEGGASLKSVHFLLYRP